MEKIYAALAFLLILIGHHPAMAESPNSSLDLEIHTDAAVPASNPQRFAVRGKFIQIDPGSTAQANLRINSISDTPRLAYPGSQFSPGDFTDLYFDYIAQPGKFLHIIYGNSPDILSSGAKAIVDPPLTSRVYANSSGASGYTFATIVTAANNVNGIKILNSVLFVSSTGSVNDDAVSKLSTYSGATAYFLGGVRINNPAAAPIAGDVKAFNIGQTYIPPGFQLVWEFAQAVAGGYTSIFLNYELL